MLFIVHANCQLVKGSTWRQVENAIGPHDEVGIVMAL